MNFLHNKKIQKLSTCFLLAVFVFINAVKTFHTHDFSLTASYRSNSKNEPVIKANFSCAICDFQIAKDSDAEVATLHIATPLKIVTSYYHFNFDNVISFSLLSSVRGPPYSYC